MQHYQILTPNTVSTYLHQHPSLGFSQQLHVTEIGDGNLNLVFLVKDHNHHKSLIIKQALPYARCVGESWPLTLDRARIEAEALLTHGQYCPAHTTKVLHQDTTMALTIMEDLSNHTILRNALMQQQMLPHFAEHAANYLANTLFYTSDFYMDQQTKKWQVTKFINPELCKITEDLFFNDPYQQHERNRYNPLLEKNVRTVQMNNDIKLAIAKLKYQFLTQTQALLHGDPHTGSIFVQENSTKFIDPEFAFYGPMGFDVGSLLANIMLNFCAQPGLHAARTTTIKYQHYLSDLIIKIWENFASLFKKLMTNVTRDPAFMLPSYQDYFVAQILSDSLGFAGAELIRRTVGLAHVKDLEHIAEPALRAQCEKHVLTLGELLLLNHQNINNIQEVTSYLTNTIPLTQ